MIRFYIEMQPNFDSQILWQKIERYRVNLTDTGERIWCYGQAEYMDYVQILYQCRLMANGPIKIELYEMKEGEKDGSSP